ncbi:MAG TPA: hypothetical protein VLA23_06660 [Candidatus Limnocylindrales bacterium]|nr:hypothetical protein [Candidatus Limnocylindrales bacterium]
MADARKSLLGELAADAALERQDAIVQATEQLQRFLDANKERFEELGGLTLIDDDPDYLSIAPDLTFRSRARYLDEATGEWQSETEVIESPSELVELYNPADLYQAFAEAAREASGLGPEPTATDELMDVAGISPVETVAESAAYAEAADAWARRQAEPPTDADSAARRLYDLALEFQERSQRSEADLLEQFEIASAPAAALLGELVVVNDDDERLVLRQDGSLRAEVIPEDAEGEWRSLTGPEDLVEFYDPTDVFGDIADAIAEGWPEVAPEFDESAEDDDAGRNGSA